MDLNECIQKGLIKNTRPDYKIVKSLIEVSNIKEKIVTDADINSHSVLGFLPMAYDSLREIMECLCIIHGYKVLNHVCIEKLLKNKYPNISFIKFDRMRYIRNSINYYGKKVDLDEGKEIIKNMFKMKKELLKILNGKLYK